MVAVGLQDSLKFFGARRHIDSIASPFFLADIHSLMTVHRVRPGVSGIFLKREDQISSFSGFGSSAFLRKQPNSFIAAASRSSDCCCFSSLRLRTCTLPNFFVSFSLSAFLLRE